MQPGVRRRLAAILAADVVGYSRLTRADEEGTIGRLKALRRDLIDPSIVRHGGRLFSTAGDGVLIEFPSVVSALRSALEVQEAMARANADVDAERRLEFRVGINLGDVVIEGDDLLGDGVNIAARLESIAPPGGICLSEDAYRQVRGKIPATFVSLGEQRLKNIEEAVVAYAVAPSSVGQPSGRVQASPAEEAHAFSIVVLPLANMSGDSTQDYLADVLTEELTSYLSRIPGGFVIARSTAFTYKGKPVNATVVGKELGVRYVFEGSVQPSGSRVRMNAQLIECATGGHIWAERFDANRTDLLEMQDEVVTRIARTLQVQLASVAAARIKRARASDVDAEAAALRAESLFLHYGVSLRAEQEGCLRLCEDVLEKNPQNVRALGILGLTHAIRVLIRQSSDRDADLARAEELSARALAADPMSYLAHHAQAAALQARRRLAESIVEDERALELNPVYIGTYVTLCNGYLALGQPETSIAYAERAIRLSPRDPVLFGLYARKGEAEFAALLDDSATVSLRRSLAFAQSESTVYAHLAAALAFKGELDEARSLLAQGLALKQARNRTIAEWRSQEISDHPRYRAYCDRLYDGLQKAGMPES